MQEAVAVAALACGVWLREAGGGDLRLDVWLWRRMGAGLWRIMRGRCGGVAPQLYGAVVVAAAA